MNATVPYHSLYECLVRALGERLQAKHVIVVYDPDATIEPFVARELSALRHRAGRALRGMHPSSRPAAGHGRRPGLRIRDVRTCCETRTYWSTSAIPIRR